MGTGTRCQFTTALKKKARAYAEANGIMAAQPKFGVTEKSTQYCREQTAQLTACNSWKTSFCGCRAVRPELEDKMATLESTASRVVSVPLTAEVISCEAVEIARQTGLQRKARRLRFLRPLLRATKGFRPLPTDIDLSEAPRGI